MIQEFAAKHRLKTRQDVDGTLIIPGRLHQSHIYEPDQDSLAVMIIREGSASISNRYWLTARKAFIAAGMRIIQDGDQEGAAAFDPTNLAQVKVAMKYGRIKSKRQVTEQQLEHLAAIRTLRSSRSGPSQQSAKRT